MLRLSGRYGASLRARGRVVATVVPDADWPGMWRARLSDGRVSDMANLTRAKDAAISLALAVLNQRQVA